MSDQRFNTGNPIGSNSPLDRSDNTRNLDVAVNAEVDTFQDRMGKSRLTWSGMEREFDAAQQWRAENFDALQSGELTNRAEAAASEAETARDAAFINADVYPDVAAGLSAVADGEQFQVVDGDEIVRYRRDSASTQTEMARYKSANYFENFSFVSTPPIGRSHATLDSDNRAASYVDRQTGVSHLSGVRTSQINGANAPHIIRRVLNGTSSQYAFDTMHVDNVGQSLWQRATGGWHYFMEPIPSAYGWPRSIENPLQSERAPLVATDGNITGTDALGYTGDFPTMAFFDFVRQLMIEEDGVYPEDRAIEMVTANNGYGSAPVFLFAKGSDYYNRWMGQVAAQKTMDDGRDRRMWVPCSHWGQGEAEYDNPNADGSAWRDIMLQIAQDKAADIAAQFPDQPLPHRMLTYQTMARPPGLSRYGVRRAIYDLCANYPELFTMTTPMHFFDYSADSTGVHITSQSTAWCGAYGGLAFKRQYIDRVAWDIPTVDRTETVGNTLYVTYNPGRMVGPWVIDTDTIAEQPNYGWTAVDDQGTDKTILSVWLCGDGHTIALQSDSPWVLGSEARYMQSPAINMGTFTGGAGNIRDTQGDHLTYDRIKRPMHNWLPLHSVTI